MVANNKTHEKFIENLTGSMDAVWNVAMWWLQSIGYPVTVNPQSLAPTREQWKEYADQGDLVIQHRIEVKQISRAFTSAADWPFGRKFIVCARHSFDRAKPKPYAYIIVSADGLYYASVSVSTAERWYVETRADVRYGEDYKQEFYLCPLELVKWGRLK
jgi:hypothetical protein